MANFPTLSLNSYYPIDEEREDSVIRSKFEGGYEQTRQRFTRLRRTWSLVYKTLTPADKTALDDFMVTVKGGADSFNWTHPVTSTVYAVRLEKPLKFSYVSKDLYDVEMTLKEV